MENNSYMSAELNQAINSIAATIKPLVEEIENGRQVTKNHYGEYMALITKLIERKSLSPQFYGLCLVRAGANAMGVHSAIKLIS